KLCQFCNGEVARATLSHDKACLDCGAVQDQAVKVDSATGATVLMGSCELVTDPDAVGPVSSGSGSLLGNKLLLRTPLGRRMSRRLVGLSQTLGIRNQSDRPDPWRSDSYWPRSRISRVRPAWQLACVLHLLCPGNAFYSLLSPDGAARYASSEVAADAAALTDTLASSWRASSIARSRLRRLGLYLALMKHGLTKGEILTALAGPINQRDLHLFSEAKEQALRLLRLHPLLQHRADLTEAQLHRYLQDLIDWRQRLVKERLALVGDADCPL
uniref:LisH domain-containing protein n=1 Tax=Macrostomum lignano TaxID=282301 RepID=A0A1I8H5G1_9PLAT